jgi:hypothetical protein
MLRKRKSVGWFFLLLTLSFAVSATAQPPSAQPTQNHFARYLAGAGDIAENPDDHIQESVERLLPRK